MARKLVDRNATDAFIVRVLERASHALGMHGPVKTIYAQMIKLIDFEKDTVEVFERNGEIARTTWVTLQGCRMVFTYDYPGKRLLLKPDTVRRDPEASFYWNEPRDTTVISLEGALRKMGIKC